LWDWGEEEAEMIPCNVSVMQSPPKHSKDNAANETYFEILVNHAYIVNIDFNRQDLGVLTRDNS
jgi:hypothetical protein